MAANAKYAPAPTQDPDEGSWSQAPPSYQAASSSSPSGTPKPSAAAAGASNTDNGGSSSSNNNDFFYGAAPRSSEDNVPDDFKFGGSVAEATVDIRHQFIRKVYTILTAQLLATAAVSGLSFWSAGYKAWIQSHPGMVWVSVSFPVLIIYLSHIYFHAHTYVPGWI